MSKFRAVAFTCLAGLLMSSSALAGDLVQWQSNSLTYLYGDGFAVNPEEQHTLTFEHASGWNVGDLFFFVDYTYFQDERDPDNGKRSYYGEFSPRFSLSKILNTKFSVGPVSDVLLASTYEFGEGDVETLLLGPGYDLDIPYFDYFQLNFYHRFPANGRDGDTTQITPIWSVTLPVGSSDVLVDGFVDWVIDNDDSYHANLHFNPQIKYDLGKYLGWQAKRFYVGVEYSYWKNKYGIKDSAAFDSDESVTSLLLKGYF